jgi:hypothetical protein
VRIPRRHEQARTRGHHLGVAADARRDHRQAGGERLEEGVREALLRRHEDGEIRRAQQIGRVRAEAGEHDAVAEAPARRLGAQRRLGTATADEEPAEPGEAIAQPRSDLEDDVLPLLRLEPRHHGGHGVLGAEAERAADGVAIEGRREAAEVDAVADGDDAAGIGAAAHQVLPHRLGVGHDPVRDAREREPEPALRRLLPHVDVALRGDQDRHARDERRQAAPEVGADEEGLDHVETFVAHERNQVTDEPQVDAGALRQVHDAHAEALDLVGLAAGAEAADDRRPAPARQAPHQLDDLLLGAADVELVDDEEDAHRSRARAAVADHRHRLPRRTPSRRRE